MNVVRCKGASLWQWMYKLAIGGQRRKRPNGRVLLCGAVAFLWERERIGNEDVIRYMNRCRDSTLCIPKVVCVAQWRVHVHEGQSARTSYLPFLFMYKSTY